MVNMEIVKHFCETSVLGLPQEPLSFLYHLKQRCGKRIHIFTEQGRLPFYLLPLAVPHSMPIGGRTEVALLRLLDFAEARGDKMLTLIPSTPEAEAFVAAHRETLEAAYMIKNKDFQ